MICTLMHPLPPIVNVDVFSSALPTGAQSAQTIPTLSQGEGGAHILLLRFYSPSTDSDSVLRGKNAIIYCSVGSFRYALFMTMVS